MNPVLQSRSTPVPQRESGWTPSFPPGVGKTSWRYEDSLYVIPDLMESTGQTVHPMENRSGAQELKSTCVGGV